MKKRILAAAIVAIMLLSAIPMSVGAKSNYSYYPVNFDKRIEYNSIGTPVLKMNVVNNTTEKITQIVMQITPKDAYGNGISKYGYGTTWGDEVTFKANGYLDEKFDVGEASHTLYGYTSATENTVVYLLSVSFADGTTWYNPGKVYEEADFIIKNPKDAYGNYIIDESHELYLVQTGCSVYARDWYIWNEGRGWVWFSDEIVPDCTVWATGAGIKLVINNNPSLYKIINFNVKVKSDPTFQISSYSSGETLSSNGNINIFNVSSAQNMPYSFGLWDNTNPTGSRAWYLRDANGKWVWFSDQRGPVCHIWRAGSNAIKLVHDGDHDNAEIFYFTINKKYSSYI